jgi:glucose/arabinose dehydrogenase
VRVRFEEGEARAVEDLITGFQRADGSRWARPVGVAIGPDGALYFTTATGHGNEATTGRIESGKMATVNGDQRDE